MKNPYAILFEPVPIGPVTAPNRFYQVPHCNGLSYRMPKALAAMRGMKAEGGWGVVCTEEVEIHHTSDLAPNIEGRIWSNDDIPAHQLMVDAVHEHGSLAGIELVHGGHHAINLYSRTPTLGLRSMRRFGGQSPGQSRRMDKEDIRNVRRWHRQAALRAKQAGYDIVYCYAGHNLSLPMHFLSRRYNQRTDEYGGSLENRVRFLRELIEETKEAVGDSCAVAVRLAVDELLGDDGITCQDEGHDIIAMLAELPDLWDVNISAWSNDSATSRFEKEGYQEQYISFVKELTSKPVVGVGRYTSPDAMVSAIERGVMDLLGAARPSIADPFLPQKPKEQRVEDIRECIGCNICVSSDMLSVPIRCTQNPTMGEEWRRGWHPEKIRGREAGEQGSRRESISSSPHLPRPAAPLLVVGGGPAGLEAAYALGKRGYEVTLVEAKQELGGRVALESALPGLIEWRRVMDWRVTQIEKMPHVELFPGSEMSADDVLESGFEHVIVATGSHWRRDGLGGRLWKQISGHHHPHVFTPDDIMAGRLPGGNVVIYDDDHYYMGGVLAEKLIDAGCAVTIVTPAHLVSSWTVHTLEQSKIQRRLMEKGVKLVVQHTVEAITPAETVLKCETTGQLTTIAADAVVLVTDREPNDGLYQQLQPALAAEKLQSLRLIGDAEAPNIIAQAIFSGYNAATTFGDEPNDDETPFKVEHIQL